jgi:hypothetical protein
MEADMRNSFQTATFWLYLIRIAYLQIVWRILVNNGNSGKRLGARLISTQTRPARSRKGANPHRPKEIKMSANRFLNLLVLMALALVATLTVREAMATSAVLSDAQKAERAQAADAARWTAMAEYYASAAEVQSRGQAADAARWTAMGEYYKNLAKSQNLDRGRAADAARWTAMADYYLRFNGVSK